MTKRKDGPWPLAPPWLPVDYEDSEIYALKQLAGGTADARMQVKALKAIVEKVCGTYDLGWHPNGDHESSFAAGRRFAGLQIVKAVNLPASLMKKEPSK